MSVPDLTELSPEFLLPQRDEEAAERTFRGICPHCRSWRATGEAMILDLDCRKDLGSRRAFVPERNQQGSKTRIGTAADIDDQRRARVVGPFVDEVGHVNIDPRSSIMTDIESLDGYHRMAGMGVQGRSRRECHQPDDDNKYE